MLSRVHHSSLYLSLSLPQWTAIATQAKSYGGNGVHCRYLLQEAGDMHPMSVSTSMLQVYAVIRTFEKENNR